MAPCEIFVISHNCICVSESRFIRKAKRSRNTALPIFLSCVFISLRYKFLRNRETGDAGGAVTITV